MIFFIPDKIDSRDRLGEDFPFTANHSSDFSKSINVRIILASKVKGEDIWFTVRVPCGLPANKLRDFQEYCLRGLKNTNSRNTHGLTSSIVPAYQCREHGVRQWSITTKLPEGTYII